MKFSINTKYFLKNLKYIQSNSSSTTNPILDGIYINVNQDDITITSSNEKDTIKIKLDQNLTIHSTGNILVKTSLFIDLISKIRSDTVEINQLDTSVIRITGNKVVADLNLLDSNLYPSFDFSIENGQQITIPSYLITKIKHKIIPSILVNSFDNNILSGILFDSTRLENKLEIVGTDSYHLSYISENFNGPKLKFVLSKKFIDLISEIISDSDIKEINLIVKEKNIILNLPNYQILSRLFDNEYPNISKIIETKNQYHFEINKDDLIDAINYATTIRTNENKWSSLQFDIKESELVVSLQSMEGNVQSNINIEKSNINPMIFYFNYKYLIDIFKSITSDKIFIEYQSNIQPIIVKDLNDDSYIGITLPIRQ